MTDAISCAIRGRHFVIKKRLRAERGAVMYKETVGFDIVADCSAILR